MFGKQKGLWSRFCVLSICTFCFVNFVLEASLDSAKMGHQSRSQTWQLCRDTHNFVHPVVSISWTGLCSVASNHRTRLDAFSWQGPGSCFAYNGILMPPLKKKYQEPICRVWKMKAVIFRKENFAISYHIKLLKLGKEWHLCVSFYFFWSEES